MKEKNSLNGISEMNCDYTLSIIALYNSAMSLMSSLSFFLLTVKGYLYFALSVMGLVQSWTFKQSWIHINVVFLNLFSSYYLSFNFSRHSFFMQEWGGMWKVSFSPLNKSQCHLLESCPHFLTFPYVAYFMGLYQH